MFTESDATHEQATLGGSGDVRWVRGEELGIETLVMDGKAQTRLGTYIKARMKRL